MTEDDYDQFATALETKYPLMFSRPYGGISTGPGWWPIVESLCFQIQNHIDWANQTREKLLVNNPWNSPIPEPVPQVIVAQIKEKFGGLRFYYDGGDDRIYGMVCMAESWAGKHCETCGNPGKTRSGGWVRTLCDHHEQLHQENMKARS